MLHFAYGANMDREVMRRHAPGAIAVGVAALADHRFAISADGYASVLPGRAAMVHGVLWRLTPRDHAGLDAWENVAAGLYRPEIRVVRQASRCRPALLYVARSARLGRPKPGYLELVIAAAQAWDLPPSYIARLQRWLLRHSPARASGRLLHHAAEGLRWT